MRPHPFAPGAIEHHQRARRLPGTPQQRRALLRAVAGVVVFLIVVAAGAFVAGVIAGAQP